MDGVFGGLQLHLHYHLGKANVVADALSHKSRGVLASYSFSGVADARDSGAVQTIVSTMSRLKVPWGV